MVNFLWFLLLLIFSFIPWSPDRIQEVIFFILFPNAHSVLETVPWAAEKDVFAWNAENVRVGSTCYVT